DRSLFEYRILRILIIRHHAPANTFPVADGPRMIMCRPRRGGREEVVVVGARPERPATIHQVASLAGVSHTTVSRYLQDKDSLKPQTRVKVDYAIKALDYRPNLHARSMRTRRTNRIAIVLPSGPNLPGRLLTAASETAHEAGYQIEVVGIDGGAKARSARVDELARSGQVEGILSISSIDIRTR